MLLSPGQLARYRAGNQKRLARRRQNQHQRQQQGWRIARQAAEHLKSQWGASKVVLFGSMLLTPAVHTRSDLDLAVWDLPETNYYRALGTLLDLDPDFSIDLVEIQHAKPAILKAIQDGVEL